MDTSMGSISRAFHRLQRGDAAAAQPLWDRFFGRLCGAALQWLRQIPRQAADEEDIALQALDSFYRRTAAGAYPEINDRDEIWGLLLTILRRKVASHIRHETRQKRGQGLTRLESDLTRDHSEGDSLLEQALDSRPSPELISLWAEECDRLFGMLGDDELIQVAQMKAAGYTSEEIARELNCTRRTVQRWLTIIRTKWEEHLQVS